MSQPCPYCCKPASVTVAKRGGGIFSTLFKLTMLYIALVWGGGALIGTGNPIAVEIGQLLHVVTFVEPAIAWSDAQGWDHVASGMRMIASGMPFNHIG